MIRLRPASEALKTKLAHDHDCSVPRKLMIKHIPIGHTALPFKISSYRVFESAITMSNARGIVNTRNASHTMERG